MALRCAAHLLHAHARPAQRPGKRGQQAANRRADHRRIGVALRIGAGFLARVRRQPPGGKGAVLHQHLQCVAALAHRPQAPAQVGGGADGGARSAPAHRRAPLRHRRAGCRRQTAASTARAPRTWFRARPGQASATRPSGCPGAAACSDAGRRAARRAWRRSANVRAGAGARGSSWVNSSFGRHRGPTCPAARRAARSPSRAATAPARSSTRPSSHRA